MLSNGQYNYVLNELSDYRSGNISQTETEQDRYALIKDFNKVDNGSTDTPGHMRFVPFGQAFADPTFNDTDDDPGDDSKEGADFDEDVELDDLGNDDDEAAEGSEEFNDDEIDEEKFGSLEDPTGLDEDFDGTPEEQAQAGEDFELENP